MQVKALKNFPPKLESPWTAVLPLEGEANGLEIHCDLFGTGGGRMWTLPSKTDDLLEGISQKFTDQQTRWNENKSLGAVSVPFFSNNSWHFSLLQHFSNHISIRIRKQTLQTQTRCGNTQNRDSIPDQQPEARNRMSNAFYWHTWSIIAWQICCHALQPHHRRQTTAHRANPNTALGLITSTTEEAIRFRRFNYLDKWWCLLMLYLPLWHFPVAAGRKHNQRQIKIEKILESKRGSNFWS